MSDWYQTEVPDALDVLHTDQQNGLNSTQVKKRLEEYGLNELVEQNIKSP